MRRIRLMILASCHNIGGSETKMDCLIKNIDRNTFEVIVLLVYPYYKAKKVPEDIRLRHKEFFSWKGIEVLELNMRYRFDVSVIYKTAAVLKKKRVDILYYFSLGWATFIGPIAGRIAKVPHIIKEVLTILEGQYPAVLRVVDRRLVSCVERVVVPSEYLKTLLIKKLHIAPFKISVIPNGVDLSRFGKKVSEHPLKDQLKIVDSAPVIGMIANLVPIKNHEIIVKAIPAVLKKFPDATFLFIGEGPLKERLIGMGNVLNIVGNLKFLGYRTDVDSIIPLFDIGILCSKVEVHPTALIEILASGVPVVAPAVGGIPEIVSHEENGLLVPQGDSNALAGAIIQLLRSAKKRKVYGEAGRKLILQKFSKTGMVNASEKMFMNLYSNYSFSGKIVRRDI